jgi:hypothetical protein
MAIDATLRGELIEQARRVAEERGWTWRDPVDVTEGAHQGEPVWIVRTNATMRSPSARIMLRRSDRAVVHAGYLPR